MPHVVTANCNECRFTDCVSVCPVSCFYGDDHRIYIDPEQCIDCGACIPKCPVSAIKEAIDLEGDEIEWEQINAERAPLATRIRTKCEPLATAEATKAALGFN